MTGSGPGPAGDVPGFVAVGHVTRDVLDDGGERAGGSALYAACCAVALGVDAAVVTAAGPDLPEPERLASLKRVVVAAERTLSFRNSYAGGARTQFVEPGPRALRATDVPAGWRGAALTLLAPVFGEVAPAEFAAARGDTAEHAGGRGAATANAARPVASLVACTLQGLLRRRAADGRVEPLGLDALPALGGVGLVALSREDVAGDDAAAERLAGDGRVVLYTLAEQGARILAHGRTWSVPACAARVVDPTGAGDTFATAFCVRWVQTGGDPLESGRFAAAAAAFAIEAPGVSGMASFAAVAARAAR